MSVSHSLLYVPGGILICLGAFVTAMNYLTWINRFRGQSASIGPLVGGLFMFIGFSLLLGTPNRLLAWIWLVLDPGCLLLFGGTALVKLLEVIERWNERHST
jgi:hypothetical protein